MAHTIGAEAIAAAEHSLLAEVGPPLPDAVVWETPGTGTLVSGTTIAATRQRWVDPTATLVSPPDGLNSWERLDGRW